MLFNGTQIINWFLVNNNYKLIFKEKFEWGSEWLLFNANWAMFQLYHGENIFFYFKSLYHCDLSLSKRSDFFAHIWHWPILAILLRPFGFIVPEILYYLVLQSFDFECIWWKLFQTRVVRTKLYIYVFFKTTYNFNLIKKSHNQNIRHTCRHFEFLFNFLI
jgi:hypothetical protein